MNSNYQPLEAAVHQIEAADLPAPLYRTARRLLDLAANFSGGIELSLDAAKAICATTSFGTVRSHALSLQGAGIITYKSSQRGDGYLSVRFTAYPEALIENWSTDQNVLVDSAKSRDLPAQQNESDPNVLVDSANSRDLPAKDNDDDAACWPHQQIRAIHQQNRAIYQQNELPELEGLEGRNIYNITLDQEFLPSGTAQSETAHRQPPPDAEAPPDLGGLNAEQQRAYALLTDPDLSSYGGLSPANALKVACRYKFPYVVSQVATWFGSEYGLGALYNRLMKPKAFPPGVPRPEFLASELYRRHYPLDRQAAEQRARMATYAPNSIEPDPVLDALPVPVWD